MGCDNSKLKKATKENTKIFCLKGQSFKCKVIDVYDGDTCTVAIVLHGNKTAFRVRMIGYDSPEMKPSKDIPNRINIKLSAIDAKIKLKEKTKGICYITCGNWDKYGRLLGTIYTKENYPSCFFKMNKIIC